MTCWVFWGNRIDCLQFLQTWIVNETWKSRHDLRRCVRTLNATSVQYRTVKMIHDSGCFDTMCWLPFRFVRCAASGACQVCQCRNANNGRRLIGKAASFEWCPWFLLLMTQVADEQERNAVRFFRSQCQWKSIEKWDRSRGCITLIAVAEVGRQQLRFRWCRGARDLGLDAVLRG